MSYKYLCPWCHKEVPMPVSSPTFGEDRDMTATCEHCNITLPIFVWYKLFELDNYREEHKPYEKTVVKVKDKTFEKRLVTDWEQTYGIENKHEYNPVYATCPFCGCRHEVRNIDLWSGVTCECGALILKEGKEVYATREE